MAHPICPLCKRELSAGTLDTRLCEQCQTLIQTASRSGDSSVMSVSASANQQLSVAHPQHFALPDNLPLELQELFDDSSVSSDSFEPDPLFAALFESQDEFVAAPPNDEQSNQVDTPEANLADGSVTASTLAIIEPAREETHLDRVDAEAESPNAERANESLSDGHAVTETQASADSTTPHVDVEGQIDDPKAIRDEVSADPWENPLPAWEYSQNEWPVLVGPRRDGPWARFKGPIVVLVILAFAAGSYYLIYRQTSPGLATDSPAPIRASRVAEPRPSATSTADSAAQDKAPLPSGDAPAKAEPKLTQPVANEAATATKEDSSPQGHFALQAASFPNRAAADEFAEKLKAAGVPSYVVSVDLPRRGTWSRVRVGRFNTAEDAQRFAAEAQLRARATGMSLELIVSRYDQP
jgi:cell division septation protein DedD